MQSRQINPEWRAKESAISNASLCKSFTKLIQSLYGLDEGGRGPWVVITEKQLQELHQEIRKSYGLPLTGDAVVKMANDGFLLEKIGTE